ncbi:MAG: hypothetical protein PHE06_02230 [Lachnospiraceae bacterium]|nr:hypothetical protein [Lachnospiraceae bacterium]
MLEFKSDVLGSIENEMLEAQKLEMATDNETPLSLTYAFGAFFTIFCCYP